MKYLFVTYLTIMLSVCMYAQGHFKWPEGKQAALSLTFDDARLSNVDVGLDLFRPYGVRVTFYVLPSGVEERLEQWRQAVVDGHEIGNHTVLHPCSGNFSWARSKGLENYSLPAMRRELLEANRRLDSLLGVTPVSFAYTCGQPFVGRGEQTQSYVPLVAEMFESGRGWRDEAANDPLFADMAQLYGVEMDGKDFEEIKVLVDDAIKNRSWLLLAGHEIGIMGRQTTRVAMLEKLIDYVQKEHPEVWIGTVGEIADYVIRQRGVAKDKLEESRIFQATFDDGVDATKAKGDPNIYTAISYENDTVYAGIHVDGVSIASEKGIMGHALKFEKKTREVLFFRAENNVNYSHNNVDGTISLWLNLDPEQDLEPGYCDPVQITDSGYNDAAYWVDFTNKNPRQFRMGVFGDLVEWNPKNIPPDENPDFERRLVVAENRPFGRGIWTHVAIVFKDINSDGAEVNFYVNGQHQGSSEIQESFTWDVQDARIYLGLNYIGLMDEVSIFNRAISAEEVQWLYYYGTDGSLE